MSAGEWIIEATTSYSRYVIAVFLVTTLLVGSGAVALEMESSLDQFETESEAAEKQAYIDEHFEAEDDTTAVQIFVRGDDVLDRESLISTLELQQEFQADDEIEPTLVDDPFDDIASVVATTAIRQEEGAEIEARQQALETDRAELDRTAENLTALLNETREIQGEYDSLNTSYEDDEIDGGTYAAESERLEGEFESVLDRADAELTDDQYESFVDLFERTRQLQREQSVAEAEGDDERVGELEADFEEVYGAVYTEVLGDEYDDLEERGQQLEDDAAALEDPERESPSTDDRIETLESMSDEEVEDVVESLLAEESGNTGLYAFLPTDYEPGSTQSDARMVIVTQQTDDPTMIEGEAPDRIVDSQLAMADLVDQRFGDAGFVFGMGIITDEIDRSLVDSMLIVLPLALLFVTVVLTIAYRDVLDIALGLAGIGVVLTWTFGFMGWTGISFNQIMIAVPVLLVGLSIDYAIHLFMRHRERRSDDPDRTTRSSMALVLSGLGLAFVFVTATAAIGFLANLVSPLGPLREFGVASAFGIVSALLVFGLFVPAVKVELDAALEARGYDRRKRAFGTGGGRLSGVLSVGQRAAGRVPWAVIALTVLLTLGGVYGATQVDTSFEEEDFLADDPPAWTKSLPGPFATGEYSAKGNLEYVTENFFRQDMQAQILVEGDITADDTLERVDEGTDEAAAKDVTVVLADDQADVRSPLTVMDDVAAANESFNATYTAADTTGDDVPDEDLESVYDELFAVAPDRAADVIYRTDDGEYESMRMVITVRGDAGGGPVTDQMDEVAAVLDGDGLTATATGQLIVYYIIEGDLFQTVIDSLLITLVAVFAFLMVAYRWRHGSALLGILTLLPIVFSVAWILGTMYLLGISFNVMTGTITSLTVGLGIAYNIHMTERYVLERSRDAAPLEALRRSVTGTGGALLGSAATTIGGFGVLVFAILPPLQQFGLITGMTIGYAFAGSVLVLPSFLLVWTRYIGPGGGATAPGPEEPRPSMTDGRGEEPSSEE